MKDLKVNCGIGDELYKICPGCKYGLNGECHYYNANYYDHGFCYESERVKIYPDGSFYKGELQVTKVRVCKRMFFNANEWFNIEYFSDKAEAYKAMDEYEEIRKIESKEERLEKFMRWHSRRFTGVNFKDKPDKTFYCPICGFETKKFERNVADEQGVPEYRIQYCPVCGTKSARDESDK